MASQSKGATLSQDQLIEKWIERDPYHRGRGDVRLKKYYVHVWALVGYAAGVGGDLAKIAEGYDIPLEAVEAAMAYYERHKLLIDDRIAANSA
jgi:uncharacterized protein (DUF433 family)